MREKRKTVTVVFVDVTESTAMAERLDAETVHAVMSRYYAEVRTVLVRHGGRVEKVIGDAVLGVFGVPVRHEDDAPRAVRAVVDMRAALGRLNDELEARWGVRLQVRTGVNTGSVVVAEDALQGQVLVFGDAVNVAARLEQAAVPGQVLLGEATVRLLPDALSVQPVGPLSVKGKSEPLWAFELVEGEFVSALAFRGVESSLVGREPELAVLHGAYDQVVRERRCRLSCVMGSAGVGKSRLTREFVDGLGEHALILHGRCLPYGEGITYWPLVEVVRQAAGISETGTRQLARDQLASLLEGHDDADEIVQRIAAVLDLGDVEVTSQETSWAARRLLEAIAVPRPLVIVFDDLQWAEPTFLELIEYLAEFARGRPILLLGLARPELLERRPEFATGATLALGPLGARDSARLVENLLEHSPAAEAVMRRVTEIAAGQPLFVVEYVRMLIDDGLLRQLDGRWSFSGDLASVAVPSSIEALLGARLDRLPSAEREVLEAAAVVGQEFFADAIRELVSPERAPDVAAHLEALAGKQLIQRQGHAFGAHTGLSFGHLLIRDVAYGGLLKQTRAQLHERFVDWLQRSAGERAEEYEEILAYHLEQAYRYRIELGPADDHASSLASRATDRLLAAARRGLARGDAPAAVNFLTRTAALVEPDTPAWLQVLPDFARALVMTGELKRAETVLEEALEGARLSGDRLLEWRARLERSALRNSMGTALGKESEANRGEWREAIEVFTQFGDEAALARAWVVVAGHRANAGGDVEGALRACEQSLFHARRHGDRASQTEALSWMLIWAVWGPMPALEGIKRCQEAMSSPDTPRHLSAEALVSQSLLLAMRGSFATARELWGEGRSMLEELGMRVMAATASQEGSEIEMLAGDPAAAERILRPACDALEAMREGGFLGSCLPRLADAIYALGRYDEAEALAQRGRSVAFEDDIDAHTRWRRVQAKVLAKRGAFDAAERLAREATQLMASTDYLSNHADALIDLAEVLTLAERTSAAGTVIAEALSLYERKGNLVAAQRAGALLHHRHDASNNLPKHGNATRR